jgi:hypothetical protein
MDPCHCANLECGCIGHCTANATETVDITNCPSYDVQPGVAYDAVPMCVECADYACLIEGAERAEGGD